VSDHSVLFVPVDGRFIRLICDCGWKATVRSLAGGAESTQRHFKRAAIAAKEALS
jgi:hypothetical protein